MKSQAEKSSKDVPTHGGPDELSAKIKVEEIVFAVGEKSKHTTDAGGKKIIAVLMNNGKIAVVSKGKGRDAEEAMTLSSGNKQSYMTAMMSRCISIDDVKLLPEDMGDMDMDEYLRLQTAFAEINF